jgi:hypothetical protein
MSTDIQKLMQILDENKENILENDYLQMCNLMKNMYNTTVYDSDDSEYLDYEYLRIVYRRDLLDIILQERKSLPFHNCIIRVFGGNELTIRRVEQYVDALVFENLSCKTYTKLIEHCGGKTRAYEVMKIYLENEYDDYNEYMRDFRRKPKKAQLHDLAYYIIDKLMIEFQFVADPTDENIIIDAKDFIQVCRELV